MPWKIYIDSRRRVSGARGDSDSSFAVQLPYPIVATGRVYCDVVMLSNAFYTIRANENDRLYLDELDAQTKRVVLLPPGQYTAYSLKDALVSALNNGRAVSGQYRVTYNEVSNRYIIDLVNPATTDSWRIWTDAVLKTDAADWIAFTTPDNMCSANRPCGFVTGPYLSGDHLTAAMSPDAPNIQAYQQLFLRSSLASGSPESLGVNFETDVIRRIVVGNVPYGGLIHDTHMTPFDYTALVGKTELSTMWFALTDVDGKVVNTHGHSISFSLIFQDDVE